jgi:hypothetical protein
LVHGLLFVIAVGCFYGILRANLLSAFAHFVFDAALIGLYASQPWHAEALDGRRTAGLRLWTALLIGWPMLICMFPFQTILVTLAGLRANILMLPALVLGSRLRGQDLKTLAFGLAVLNVVVLGFAGAEYFLGVARFFPESDVTDLILSSSDAGGDFVVGNGSLRIPSTFVNSAVYGATMVLTLPLLFATWSQNLRSRRQRILLVLAMAAAFIGVLMSASRSQFMVAGVVAAAAAFGGHLRPRQRFTFVTVIVAMAAVAMSSERFQRFQTLSDKDMITGRIGGSVNRTFLEILTEYPMGHGLGAIGTGVPSFLRGQIKLPIVMESEYARIVLELGIIGLVLWIGFILWALSRATAFERNAWTNGRRLVWFCCVCYFGTGLIGIGLLTAIPNSFLLFLLIGWITTRQNPERSAVRFYAATFSSARMPEVRLTQPG